MPDCTDLDRDDTVVGSAALVRPTGAGRRFRVAAVLSGMALTAGFAFVPAGTALADPPLTVADAKAQIEQLEVDAEALDQDYAGVQEQIASDQTKLTQKQSDAKDQSAKLAKLKVQVGQVALAKFQNRDLDTAAQLFFTEDTQGFLSQISTVEKVSDNQNTVLQKYQQQQAELADLKLSTQAEIAGLEAKEKNLKELRTSSEAKVTAAKTVLSQLSVTQQQSIAAAQQKQADEAKAAAEKASAAGSSSDSPAATNSSAADSPSATDTATNGSSRGGKALAFAKSQIGKPYRFGSSGPGAYDCSGLTGAAWRAVGVSLPRTSQGQYHAGRSVSRSELQPGDLVFFYGGISHVGLYAGNGMIVHSPRPGKSVSYISMKSMPFAGARRPG